MSVQRRGRRTGVAWAGPLARCLLAWCLLAFAGGCQVPDAGPFVAATAQLKGAVAAGGAAVEQELRHAFADAERADELKSNWEARNKAMTALLRYAQSLEAIAAAGNQGAESAGKVADAVKGLAEAAGVAIPASEEALAVATDTVKFIYGQIARARAAGALAAALDAAQPAVERVAQLMRKDLEDLSVIDEAAAGLQAAQLVAEHNALSAQRKAILAAINGISNPTTQPSRGQYAALTKLLAEVDARYAGYRAELQKIEERLLAARAVIDATGRALDEWAAAHAELAAAARHRRAVSTQSLIAAAVELRDLVKRMRDL